jgi:hypothetical protein
VRKKYPKKPTLLRRKSTRSKAGLQRHGPHISKSKLNALVEQAIVDAYDESEQAMGFFNMVEENLRVPFLTNVLSVEVIVESIELTQANEIVAVCRKDKVRQKISVLELPLPSPFPEGVEWIAAYRYWRGGFS